MLSALSFFLLFYGIILPELVLVVPPLPPRIQYSLAALISRLAGERPRNFFVTLFDLPQNTNNDKTRQLHKSK